MNILNETSAELLENGFDDSQNEPDITDFW